MKTIAVFTAIAFATAAAAHADPVIVDTPKAPVSTEAARDYVSRLESAVKEVCFDVAAPVIGVNHYMYLACIKATRAQVAKDDPTGLYAARDTAEGLVLAAK
jgi:hypothetical protein